jgi:plastocyanin
MTRLPIACSVLLAALTLTACGGQEQPAGDSTPQTAAAPAPAATNMGENLTPDPGGKIIIVQMMTDDQGNNRYEPAEFEAHQGDVVRYTLKTGVHNVNFLPDSNVVKTNLPPATPLLQLPGQTIDIKVTMPPGKYYFHCDPHALLGMKGRLEVEAKD